MILFWGSKVKVTMQINAHTVSAQYVLNGKAYVVQTWYTDGAWRPVSATSVVNSKVKVARSRDASDRGWPISQERNVLEIPKLVGMPTSFKVKGLGHMVNNTTQ